MTTESKTRNEILQQGTTIRVDGYEYVIAAPTLATLIEVSAAISELPQKEIERERLIESVLKEAHKYADIGRIVATMILGAKEAGKAAKLRLFGLTLPFHGIDTRAQQLGGLLMQRHGPSGVMEIMVECVKRMECGDFFALTTFLSGANTLKATKVDAATAPGQ